MIDWGLMAKVGGGGYGLSILVLMILLLIAWVMGLVIQKIQAKNKETSAKKEE